MKSNKNKTSVIKIIAIATGLATLLNLGVAYAESLPPDAITDLSATSANGSVILNWSAPSDNGSPITSYRIEYNPGFTDTCTTDECTDTTPGATIKNLENFKNYGFRVMAINRNGQSQPSNIVFTTPQPCGQLLSNQESPAQTVSEQCLGIKVKAGSLYLSRVPKSFQFPIKPLSAFRHNQDVFSNPSGITGPNGTPDPFGNATTDPSEDIVAVTDLRGPTEQDGFRLTITADRFNSGPDDFIPLRYLYVVSSLPTVNDLPNNPELLNENDHQIAYAAYSKGIKDISSTVDTTGPVNRATTFTSNGSSFDPDNNNQPNPVVLMNTFTGHTGTFSTALSFYVNVPGAQPAGNYATIFTIDLIAQ